MTFAVLSAETGWIILGGFSVLWLVLGWFWGRRHKTFDGHVLAGRNVGLAAGHCHGHGHLVDVQPPGRHTGNGTRLGRRIDRLFPDRLFHRRPEEEG